MGITFTTADIVSDVISFDITKKYDCSAFVRLQEILLQLANITVVPEEKSEDYGIIRLRLLGIGNKSAQDFTEILLIPVEIFQ